MSETALIEELCERSANLCTARHVLCIQDTTEINLSSQMHRIKDDSGLGRLDYSKPQLGFKMHSTLMLDATNNDLLGFAHVKLWHRPLEMADRKERQYQKLPVEQKESYKWIEAATKCCQLLQGADMITFIEDREGDFYEQLSSIAAGKVHYIIRSKSNRNTIGGLKAWDALKEQPVMGTTIITLRTDRRKNRKKKVVALKLRYAPIELQRGSHIKNQYC